jgi:penicillin-binding protein 2
MRISFFYAISLGIYILLGLSLFNLQVIQGGRYRELSKKNCIRLISQSGTRGKILDTNGDVIAGNHVSYDIVILPQELHEVQKTLVPLAGLLHLDSNELWKRFSRNYAAPNMPVVLVEDVGLRAASEIEEKRFDFDSVIVQTNSSRYYPFGSLACHVLGYISEIDRWRLTELEDYGYKTKDLVGFGGVEERYDYYLRQEDGGLSVEVDHQGRFIRTLGYKPGEQGRDLQLTLDRRIQRIVEDSFDGKGGVIVMDASTGAVVAMASKPSFFPSVFIKKQRATMAELFSSSSAPMVNRAISASYPPGSVFKLLVACAGLETGKINSRTEFGCPGFLMIGRRQFKCWDTHGTQDLLNAIAHSCDVFFYHTGLNTGPQAIHDYAVKFGFAKPTGIELPYEATGFIPNPLWRRFSQFRQWYDGDTANMAIGQGELLVSPLQICRMVAVFANGGKLVTPYLIKAIDNAEVWRQHMRITDLHLKLPVVQAVRKGMRKAVESGTCSALVSLPVSVAGKTGTAQVSGKEFDTHAWFAGFFPYDKPQYAICVFLEKGGHGSSAVEVAKRVIEQMCQADLLDGAAPKIRVTENRGG